jgi:hypothetical protein
MAIHGSISNIDMAIHGSISNIDKKAARKKGPDLHLGRQRGS